ncbi:MAG: hypothetical protein ACI4LH_09510 [Candidatus Heritagella sp.]
MICRYCGAQYRGKECPECGTPAGKDRPACFDSTHEWDTERYGAYNWDQAVARSKEYVENLPHEDTPAPEWSRRNPPASPPPTPPASRPPVSAPGAKAGCGGCLSAFFIIFIVLFILFQALGHEFDSWRGEFDTEEIFDSFLDNTDEVFLTGSDTVQIGESLIERCRNQTDLPSPGENEVELTSSFWYSMTAEENSGCVLTATLQVYDTPLEQDGWVFFPAWPCLDQNGEEPEASFISLYAIPQEQLSRPLQDGDYLTVSAVYMGNYDFISTAGTLWEERPAFVVTQSQSRSWEELYAQAYLTLSESDPRLQNAYAEQRGCRITVTGVEFSEAETRVSVRIENQSGETLHTSYYMAVLEQNGKEYQMATNYEANYAYLPYTVEPGETAEGLVTFGSVSAQDDFTVSLPSTLYDGEPTIPFLLSVAAQD